jgi:hypothetical protein
MIPSSCCINMKRQRHYAPNSKRVVIFLHRWLGLLLVPVVVLYAISGLLLNHRRAIARLDVPRSWLPIELKLSNWNQGVIKDAVVLSEGERLVYGSAGIWRTPVDFSSFTAFNQGLPAGADRRNIERVFRTTDGALFAGTRYGLFRFSEAHNQWEPVALPDRKAHVIDLAQKGDALYVLTRSELFVSSLPLAEGFRAVALEHPVDWDGRVPLMRLLWDLHDGSLFGGVGRLSVDLLAIVVLLLAGTSLILFCGPAWMRWRKKKGAGAQIKTAAAIRWSRKWHRRTGLYMTFFLLVSVIAGMFLRPPLLIAILRKRVTAWPGTALHNAGPWHDRLRRLLYDESQDAFMISTADGFYLFDGQFERPPHKPAKTPPVSVMGVKVFQCYRPGMYLVGSFNGLYVWCPEMDFVLDWISKTPPNSRSMRSPFGAFMVAGYLRDGDRDFVFDYRTGLLPLHPNITLPAMPVAVRSSPLPLWNLALEIHTGRLYSFLPNPVKMLWIGISGQLFLILLLSGFAWNSFRKKRYDDSVKPIQRRTP